jgi:hypothetical protein
MEKTENSRTLLERNIDSILESIKGMTLLELK